MLIMRHDVEGLSPAGPFASINPAGAVTGSYDRARKDPFSSAGFIRDVDGTIITFTVPGASDGFNIPTDINTDGVVTGRYSAGAFAGFVRATDGTFTTFQHGIDTEPLGINSSGDVVGNFFEIVNNAGHRRPFIRHEDGTVETFDAPGATETHAAAINAAGTVTGSYSDGTGQHSFVRGADGAITTFDAPGATSTVAETISPLETVAGAALIDGCRNGFIRNRFGVFTIFNLPSASADEIEDGFASPSPRRLERSLESARAVQLSTPVSAGGSWTLQYSLPADGDVSMAVYDVASRSVALLDRGFRTAGAHQVSWAPTGVARGVYYVRLKAGTAQRTKAIAIRN